LRVWSSKNRARRERKNVASEDFSDNGKAGVTRHATRAYHWRAQNLLTMRERAGTAATLLRAEAAAETVLVVAEVVGPAGVLYRYDRRAPSGMKWARSRG
jgi:hypothetical protein